MSPELAVWAFGAVIAVMTLLSMMRRRQTHLAKLLQGYVEKHIEWTRRRRKAARLAREALAKHAADQRAVEAIMSRRAALNPAESAETAATDGDPALQPTSPPVGDATQSPGAPATAATPITNPAQPAQV